MKTSAHTSRVLEIYRRLEPSWAPYEPHIQYGFSVVTWQRPIDLGVLACVVYAILYFLWKASMSLPALTLLCFAAAVLCAIRFAMVSGALSFNWLLPIQTETRPPAVPASPRSVYQQAMEAATNLVGPVHTSAHSEAFDYVLHLYIKLYIFVANSYTNFQEMSTLNPTRFYVQAAVSFVCLGLVGCMLSPWHIIVICVTAVLFGPGIYYNNVIAKGMEMMKPLLERALDSTATSRADAYKKVQ